jgi:hypothetical protein
MTRPVRPDPGQDNGRVVQATIPDQLREWRLEARSNGPGAGRLVVRGEGWLKVEHGIEAGETGHASARNKAVVQGMGHDPDGPLGALLAGIALPLGRGSNLQDAGPSRQPGDAAAEPVALFARKGRLG